MADNNGVFPNLVIDIGPSAGRLTAPTASPTTQRIESALREVLAWRPLTSDSKGFVAALNQAFTIQDVDGHTEWAWTPRSYAVQADMGAVTGAQASIYARAKAALDQSRPLIEGLYPLLSSADKEDAEAIRALVLSQLTELVSELGNVGGPRLQRVDGLFDALLGGEFTPESEPEDIEGLLAVMRARFGFEDDQVNTIDEEQNLTNYLIVADHVMGLFRSWETLRRFFDNVGTDVFLGTQLVLLSRLLAVIGESVQEAYFLFDAAFVGASERQTIRLDSGLTIEDLLSWAERFATVEAPQIIRDAGKDGVVAIQPTLEQLLDLVRQARQQAANPPFGASVSASTRRGTNLIARQAAVKGPPRSGPQAAAAPVQPAEESNDLQLGFYTARVRAALIELEQHLEEAVKRANQIRRGVGLSVTSVYPDQGARDDILRLMIDGAGFEEIVSVTLQREGENPIEGTDIRISGDARLYATIDLANAAVGEWEVVVNVDEIDSEPSGRFTVIDSGNGGSEIPLEKQFSLSQSKAKQGDDVDIIISAAAPQRFTSDDSVLVGPGILLKSSERVDDAHLKASIRIGSNARLGVHDIILMKDRQPVLLAGALIVDPSLPVKTFNARQIDFINTDKGLSESVARGEFTKRRTIKQQGVDTIQVVFDTDLSQVIAPETCVIVEEKHESGWSSVPGTWKLSGATISFTIDPTHKYFIPGVGYRVRLVANTLIAATGEHLAKDLTFEFQIAGTSGG